MSALVNGFYRGDNTVDTGTCKVHSHLHLPQDCFEYGSPMNYDAALGERGLKFWAKGPSRTARKCGETTFITQTSSRISDHQLLSKAFSLLQKKQHPSPILPSASASIVPGKRWHFTRKVSHMVYELSTKLVGTVLPEHNIPVYEGPHCRDLLLDPIVQQLHSSHGNLERNCNYH